MFWKVIVGLLLTLPLGAYITGTLVASQADMPSERAPVVLDATPSDVGSATPPPASEPATPRPSTTRSPDDDGDDDDDGRGRGRGRGGDDEVEPVRPTPRDVDDDGDDRGDDHGGDDRDTDDHGEGDDDD